MNEILHFIGLCPDSLAHWDLLDLLALTGSDIYFAIYSSPVQKIISFFRKN